MNTINPSAGPADILTLRSGTCHARVAPSAGGRLMDWVVDGQAVLYWPESADWTAPARIRGGNPVLFPFLGRHFVDREAARWRDRQGTVRPMPQHGFARDLPFAAEQDADGAGVSLTLDSRAIDVAADYPFDFRFTIGYRLQGNTLRAVFETENRGDAAMPYYAGHHFYFALPHGLRAESRLTLPPSVRQMQSPQGAPSAAEPDVASFTLDDATMLDVFHVLRTPQAGGVACLDTPTLGRQLRIVLPRGEGAPWHALTTWTLAPDSDFYCVEPWLGLPDAIHHGQGLRMLAPGQLERAVCVLEVAFDGLAHAASPSPSAQEK